MKNITVSVDEETHRQARIRAAELGTSVSALVRGYLRDLCTNPAETTGTSGQDTETEAGAAAQTFERGARRTSTREAWD